jgi:hypothetical protein
VVFGRAARGLDHVATQVGKTLELHKKKCKRHMKNNKYRSNAKKAFKKEPSSTHKALEVARMHQRPPEETSKRNWGLSLSCSGLW